MTGAAPRKRNGGFGWFLALVALLEILVIVAIVVWIRMGAPCDGGLSALPPSLSSLFGGHAARGVANPGGAAAGGGAADVGGDAQGAGTTGSGGAAGTANNGSAAAGSAAGGSAQANGDLNQVPDPNCVAKTAAGLLNSDQATPQPSCGAFKAPAALKAAAAQVQNGVGTSAATPNAEDATPTSAAVEPSAAPSPTP